MLWVLLAGIVLLAALEIAVRSLGLVDFPLYIRDPNFGYFPKSGQAGAFRNTNHWVFNDRGMGVPASWHPTDQSDILLIGNSVVSGGNAYDQSEKLTSRLQVKLGEQCPLWPIAVGAWTTVNATHYLQVHPDLIEGSDFFIWEFMTSQMDHANPWTGETRLPTNRPLWASGYVLKKALAERLGILKEAQAATVSDFQKNYDDFEGMIARLAKRAQHSPRGIILAYPDKGQFGIAHSGREWLPDRQRLERLAQANDLLLVDLARMPAWTEGMYWDDVHPNPFGNVVLSSILGDLVASRAPGLKCKPAG
jgi:hypothetical protein